MGGGSGYDTQYSCLFIKLKILGTWRVVCMVCWIFSIYFVEIKNAEEY